MEICPALIKGSMARVAINRSMPRVQRHSLHISTQVDVVLPPRRTQEDKTKVANTEVLNYLLCSIILKNKWRNMYLLLLCVQYHNGESI